jgi:hypothetical protein
MYQSVVSNTNKFMVFILVSDMPAKYKVWLTHAVCALSPVYSVPGDYLYYMKSLATTLCIKKIAFSNCYGSK